MIPEIQYLRAIAALMVVLYHTFPQLERMGYTGSHYSFLSHGVDIFFVISGFIMTYISYGRPQKPLLFLWRRILRIVPLYWALTLLIAAIGILAPSLLQSSVVTPDHLLASLFFVPMTHPVNGFPFPLLQPGWTLNYEMYFYLVFALFLWLATPWRYAAAVLALLALTAGAAMAPDTVASRFYSDPIVLEFALGMGLAMLYCTRADWFALPRGDLVGAALVVGGIAVIAALEPILSPAIRLFTVGLPSLAIVAGGLIAAKAPRRAVWPLVEKIGTASYSLYLSHFIAMSAIGQIFRKIVGTDAGPAMHALFVLCAPVFCVLISFVIYDLFEARLQRAFSLARSAPLQAGSR